MASSLSSAPFSTDGHLPLGAHSSPIADLLSPPAPFTSLSPLPCRAGRLHDCAIRSACHLLLLDLFSRRASPRAPPAPACFPSASTRSTPSSTTAAPSSSLWRRSSSALSADLCRRDPVTAISSLLSTRHQTSTADSTGDTSPPQHLGISSSRAPPSSPLP